MQQLLTTTWRICLLKAGPQDMPYSLTLLIVLLLVNVLVSIMALSINALNAEVIQQSLLLLIIPIIFTYLVLSLYQRTARFIQTVTAQNAVNILLSLLMIPFLILHPGVPVAGQPVTSIQLLISLFYILVFFGFNIWLIIITAHIYRHALDINYLRGLLVTLGLMGVNILVFSFMK